MMLETVCSKRLKTKTEFIQILRWEDDGGAVYDIETPLPQVAETNTTRSMEVTEDDLHMMSKETNTQKETKMNPFVSFMASSTGRIVRVVAGIILVAWGWFGLAGTTGMIVMLVGIVPLAAGIFDFCVLAPLFGAPLSGPKIRAGK